MNFDNFKSNVLDFIEKDDYQRAEDYIKENISKLSEQVSALRERIAKLQERVEKETNSDEVLHIEYDLKDLKESLTKSTKNLNLLNELYDQYINNAK